MDRLDLRLLDSFIAVAEELHFGRAAARLHIAQPSLSQQIRRLEGQLGVELLRRTSRRVELTVAGEALLEEGRKTMAQARRAVEAARRSSRTMLRVGFYGSAATALLPEALAGFARVHPGVEVSVRELLMGTLDDVLCGAVDVAFTRLLPAQTDLQVEVIGTEARLAALAASHPLAGRACLAYGELASEGFIVNPAVPGDGAPPRWLAEQRRHRLAGRAVARGASVQEILALVAAERGVAMVPATVARHHPRQDVAYVPVQDADPAVVSLAWAGEAPALVEDFVAAARAASGRRLGAGV